MIDYARELNCQWVPLLLCAAACLIGSRLQAFDCKTMETRGPVVKPWKEFAPDVAYHGQWLVAGDLDGDGIAEIVTARNEAQEVTAVLASRLDGAPLWKWGRPDTGRQGLSYDVPVQLYDLDGDGTAEVYLSVKGAIVVLDGATGKELRRLPLPKGLKVADCITFVDLRGLGKAQDVIVKTRYHDIWAYTADWRPLWHWRPKKYLSCHHPTPVDIDGDGRDEIIAGYTLLDDDGKELWTLTSEKVNLARGHVDCSEVFRLAKRPEDTRLLFTYCGANCVSMSDGRGRILWEVTGHHFESADIGSICQNAPGPHICVDIDHLPFGKSRVWLLDREGKRLGEYKCNYGRHHRLIDWNGDGLLEVLIANTRRLFNCKGECVAQFGPLGGFDDVTGPQQANDPGPFALIADLDGDQRPEVVLHSTRRVRVYKSQDAARVPGMKLGTPNFTLY